jgi:hypothetical protein
MILGGLNVTIKSECTNENERTDMVESHSSPILSDTTPNDGLGMDYDSHMLPASSKQLLVLKNVSIHRLTR